MDTCLKIWRTIAAALLLSGTTAVGDDYVQLAQDAVRELDGQIAKFESGGYGQWVFNADLVFEAFLETENKAVTREAAIKPPKLADTARQAVLETLLARVDRLAELGFAAERAKQPHVHSLTQFAWWSGKGALAARYDAARWRALAALVDQNARGALAVLRYWELCGNHPGNIAGLTTGERTELAESLVLALEADQTLRAGLMCGSCRQGPDVTQDAVRAWLRGSDWIVEEYARRATASGDATEVSRSTRLLVALLEPGTTGEGLTKAVEAELHYAEETAAIIKSPEQLVALYNGLLQSRGWLLANNAKTLARRVETTLRATFPPSRLALLDAHPPNPAGGPWQPIMLKSARDAYWTAHKQAEADRQFAAKYPPYKGLDHLSSEPHALLPLDGIPATATSDAMVRTHPQQVLEHVADLTVLSGREGWKQFPQRLRPGQTVVLEAEPRQGPVLRGVVLGESGKLPELEIAYNERQIWRRAVTDTPSELEVFQGWEEQTSGRFSFHNHGPGVVAFDAVWFERLRGIHDNPDRVTFDMSTTQIYAVREGAVRAPRYSAFSERWETPLEDLPKVTQQARGAAWAGKAEVPKTLRTVCTYPGRKHGAQQPLEDWRLLHAIVGYFQQGGTELILCRTDVSERPTSRNPSWFAKAWQNLPDRKVGKVPIMVTAVDGSALTGVHWFAVQSQYRTSVVIVAPPAAADAFPDPFSETADRDVRVTLPLTSRRLPIEALTAVAFESLSDSFLAGEKRLEDVDKTQRTCEIQQTGPNILSTTVRLKHVAVLTILPHEQRDRF